MWGVVSGVLIAGMTSAINGVLWFIGVLANAIGSEALAQAQLPWVHETQTVVTTMTWSLLAVYIAYVAVTRYILWNAGTADPDGSVLLTSIGRAVAYSVFSGLLVTSVFQFGLWFAEAVFAAPVGGAAAELHQLDHHVLALANLATGAELILVGAVVLGTLGLLVVAFQMLVRAAELTVYLVAAPLAGLGQMNPDGGIWTHWWRGLVG